MRRTPGRQPWGAVAVVCAGVLAAALTVLPESLRPVAIVAVVGLVVAGAQVVPSVVGHLLARSGRFADLAAGRALAFGRRRFAYVIGILALAIAVSVGLDGAAASLKADVGQSVAAWTRGDLFVRAAPPGRSLHDQKFAASALDELRDVAGIDAVGWFSYSTIELHGTRIPVWTWSADDVTEFVELRVADGARGSRLWELLDRGDVAISHNFARLHDVDVGDTVSLPTTTGTQGLTVAAVVDDSASDAGVVVTGASAYTALTGDRRAQEIQLRLDPRADPRRVAGDVTAMLSDEYAELVVYDREEIRRAFASLTGDLLDSFVIIGRSLFVVALLVGATATITGLAARRSELGVLRLTGADRDVVRAQLLRESLAVAVAAWAIGFPAGFGLVPLLLQGLSVQTGVLPAVTWPWLAGVLSLPAAVVLSVAGLALAAPGRRLGPLAEQLRAE